MITRVLVLGQLISVIRGYELSRYFHVLITTIIMIIIIIIIIIMKFINLYSADINCSIFICTLQK